MREADATIARSPSDVSRGGSHKLMRALDHQEVEWQFDADDLGPIEDWLKEHSSIPGFAILSKKIRELTDTYYDTEDWRFYRAGYALRIRRDGKKVEATMKSLSPAEDGGLKRRREISEPLKNGGVKTLTTARGPVGERLRLLAGMRDLRQLFEVRTRRKTFELRPTRPQRDIGRKEEGSGGAVLAEVALDESEFLGGGRRASLNRVEVEISDEGAGSYGEVAGFVDGMRGSLELVSAEASKFETGISASGLSPDEAPELGPTEVDASLSAGEKVGG
jgi:triphosphatase